MPTLDPLVIAQLGSLELKARRILEGFFTGHYIRRIRGASQEFSEHRPYNIGDDLKKMDWKIFGRSDRLVVKSFHEETNIAGTVIMDTSASMAFCEQGRLSKLDYARILAAALGTLLVNQNDGIGLSAATENLPVGRGRAFLNTYFDRLDRLQPQGKDVLSEVIGRIAPSIKRKQILLIFSDLMQDPAALVSALMPWEAKKYEVMVFQILDPSELDLPYKGPIIFEDSETRELLRTDPEAIREQYKAQAQQRLHALSSLFRKAGIEYVMFTTDMSFDAGLGAYLSWRRALL
jgi:uncharacterized protein (DUF58 family)